MVIALFLLAPLTPMSVYIFSAVIGVLWAIAWYRLATSTPNEHPKVSADELYRLGLIEASLPPEDLMPYTMDLAREIASKAPIAAQGKVEIIVSGCTILS